jgi:ubiquinone/menaquinone biosynthesis C-methylase UbiE
VVGVDVNLQMLSVARSVPPPPGAAIEWCEASALSLPFAARSFDAVLCQFGLQFFPDRLLALTEMKRVLMPNGRLGLSVHGPIENNPAALALVEALDWQVGRDATLAKRVEHALADVLELKALIAQAGYRDPVVETVVKRITFTSVAEYVRVQLTATPLASTLTQYDKEEQNRIVQAVINDVSVALSAFTRQRSLVYPQEVHVALTHA